MAEFRKAVVVGISGCSSSGKTTLSRLLRDIFPNTFVLHEDDFYRPETELPEKYGLLDWDCAESLNIPDIVRSLDYIHKTGAFPVSDPHVLRRTNHGIAIAPSFQILTTPQPDLNSKEDQNSVGECPVSDALIESLKAQVIAWTEPGKPGHEILGSPQAIKLCLFDGFLLYSNSMASVQPQIDVKIFLRVSYAKAKARREARSGYVTLEGFWEDPPGYVDKIVWPNYVEDHKWMFEHENVEGKPKDDVFKEWNIKCQDGGVDVDFATTLHWAVETLMNELPLAVGL